LVELCNEGKPTDLVVLQDRLKEKNVPPEISNLDYVRDLIRNTETSSNVNYYANIVWEKSILRKLIRTTEAIANECYAGKAGMETILENTEKDVFNLLQQNNHTDFTPISEIVVEQLNKISAAAKSKGSVTGVPTGFLDLDYMTSGLQPSDFVLIAARPSMGKTAFVLNIAQHVAFKEKSPVAIFSLEMSKGQLVNRLFAMESKVDSQKIRKGRLTDEEWSRLGESADIVGLSPLIIDDTPGISIGELRSKCRKYKLEHDIKMVIIDYLQLMTSRSRTDSRQQEVSEISRSLKALARELNVPVVALSQLSRAVEQRPDHRPMLSDLRESGSIEQDADVVMFIYRDDYYHPDTEKKNISEINIAKQRNGPVGMVELVWIPEFTKFANKEKGSHSL
jgi:replicative DNA helicase